MKRTLALQIGLTTRKKLKRPSSPEYRGGSDPNKGKQKRWWFERICSVCSFKMKGGRARWGTKCPICGNTGEKYIVGGGNETT